MAALSGLLFAQYILGFYDWYDKQHYLLTFVTGLSKFFGQVAQHSPNLIKSDYPEVLRCIFSGVDSDDLNIFIPSLEVIGMIAYSPAGKMALHKEGKVYHAMGYFCQHYSYILWNH